MIVPLRLTPGSPDHVVARHGEPVTVGVPVPRGAIAGAGTWHIEPSAGEAVPAQARVLDRWPDGSARWVLLDFNATHEGAGTQTLRAVWTPGARPAVHPARVTVAQTGEAIVVDTGAARFHLRPGQAFPFAGVEAGGRQVLVEGSSRARVLDDAGMPLALRVDAVEVEEPGPQRASVALRAHVSSRRGDVLLDCLTRLHFYAGLGTVRVFVRVRNPKAADHPGGFWDLGAKSSVYLEEFALRLAMPGTARAWCSAEPGHELREVELPFELYQDSSGGERWNGNNHLNRRHAIPVSFRGYRMTAGRETSSGLRATPLVRVSDGTSSISAVRPWFWQNFPVAVSVDARGLDLGLFAGQFADVHEIQGGEQKTHEFYLAFGDDPVSTTALDWCRNRLVAGADPRWYAETGAIPWLTALEDDPYREYAALVAAAIEGPDTFHHKREVVDEYGWRHFGDIYGDHENAFHKGPQPLVSHYNNQYDAVGGFALQFMRNGDVRWWSHFVELARHVVDIDIYHTEHDKVAYNHGQFWHTYHYGEADIATHRSYPLAGKGKTWGGGPSADQNYATGLMLHYFMTGDPESRETVVNQAQYVIDLDDGKQTVFRWLSRAETGKATASGSYDYHGPGRSPANSLNALVDGHRLTGEVRFLEKAEQLIRRCVHPRQDVPGLNLGDVENRWFYLMFLQALGKYLAYKVELGQLDAMYAYGRESLLHLARWMAEHEYPYLDRPEILEFPTETWPAQDVRKADIFLHAAMHAEGPERGRFVERGRFFFDHSVATLAGLPTRTFCRPVVLLLSNGHVRAWFERHSAFRAPAPGAVGGFGEPERFVPQREIAMRRAKAVVVAGGGAALVVLAFLAYVAMR